MSNKQSRVKASLVHLSLKLPWGNRLLLLFLLYRPESRYWQRVASPWSWESPPLNARFKEGLCTTELNRNRYPRLLVLPTMLYSQPSRVPLIHISMVFHTLHINQLQSPKNHVARSRGPVIRQHYSRVMYWICFRITLPKYQAQTTYRTDLFWLMVSEVSIHPCRTDMAYGVN